MLLQRWKSLDEAWRFAILAFLVVRLFYAAWTALMLVMQPLVVQNIEIDGEPVLTVFSLEDSRAYTYLRQIDGENLLFRAGGKSQVTDEQTGSLWDVSTGRAIGGAYQEQALEVARTKPEVIFPYHLAEPFPIKWLALWQRFDANWYVSVAENGYGSVPGDDHFPPLFPLLIRLLMPLVRNAFLAGLLINHLATLYGIKLLYEAFAEWGEKSLARRSALFVLLYPTSFFLFSAYTESVFLVSALLALRSMRKRSWGWAGFWTFCAILTRLQGAALIGPMLYLMWQDGPFLRRVSHWFGLALSGFSGLFYLYLRSRQVTEGAVPFVEPEWHARLVPPWETYGYAVQTILSGQFTFVDVLNWVVVTLFILLLIAGWRRIPLEYNLYAAFSLLIMLIRIVETQPLISMSRYSLTLFPCFFALRSAGEHPWLRRVIIYTFIPLNLYLSAQFFLWGWVA